MTNARAPRPRRAAAALGMAAALLGVAAGAGCVSDREQGVLYRCTCAFLTDFDDPSSVRVDVCGRDAASLVPVARGCAQSAAPAPIQGCACAEVVPAERCKVDECRSVVDP